MNHILSWCIQLTWGFSVCDLQPLKNVLHLILDVRLPWQFSWFLESAIISYVLFFCCFLNSSDICDIGVHLWFVIGSVSVIWWRQISPILPKVIECQTQPGLDSDASNVGFYTARRDGLPRPESDQQIIRPPDTSMYFWVFLKKTM